MPTLSDIFGDVVGPGDQELAQRLVENDDRLLEHLVALRRQKKLTQQDVAVACGVSQPTIAAFERYDSDPKLSTVRRYAHAIGANVEHAVMDAAEPSKLHWTFGTPEIFVKIAAPAAGRVVHPRYVADTFAKTA